jgi:hypothetical protein
MDAWRWQMILLVSQPTCTRQMPMLQDRYAITVEIDVSWVKFC